MSLQIKALEEDLGVQLFDRSGAHIKMTPAGHVLLEFAVQSNALLVQAEREIGALSGEHAGQLALGASTTIAQYVLPRCWGISAGSILAFTPHWSAAIPNRL